MNCITYSLFLISIDPINPFETSPNFFLFAPIRLVFGILKQSFSKLNSFTKFLFIKEISDPVSTKILMNLE